MSVSKFQAIQVASQFVQTCFLEASQNRSIFVDIPNTKIFYTSGQSDHLPRLTLLPWT